MPTKIAKTAKTTQSASNQPPLVECKNLTKIINKHIILDDINLTIPRGKIIGLLGRNGAGKSTLLKTINDLIVPSCIISYLPERTYLDKTMRVTEAIKFFTEFYSDFDVKKAQKLVENLNLNLDQKISTMSKGMQEKLQLILVMSRQAKLYILDEPLGGIDDGASMIISTHLIADIERILDEVIFIDQGKILLTADADTLRTKHHASIDEIFRQKFNHESKIS